MNQRDEESGAEALEGTRVDAQAPRFLDSAASRPLPLLPAEVPALDDGQGGTLCYLDSAATSLKPRAVVDRMARFYLTENAPVHRGVYESSQRATDLYEAARRTVAAFVGAEPEGLIFTAGTTGGLNLLARAWGEKHLKPGDEILVSPQEHHSNFVPWQVLAERTGATLRYLPLSASGTVDLKGTLALLGDRTRLVAMAHVSNVLGVENPVREVFEAAHRVGAVTVLDGAQSVPTRPVSLQSTGADALVFSGHKMMGPTGIGALAFRADRLGDMDVVETGGGMIDRVAVEGTTFLAGAGRYEAGTPHAAGAIGLAAAVEFLQSLEYEGAQGMEAVARYEQAWGQRALEGVRSLQGLRIVGPPGDAEPEGGIVALQMDGVHPHDLAVLLDAQGVMVRAGHHCTMPLHAHLAGSDAGLTPTSGSGAARPETSLRASGYVYNPMEHADRLVDALAFAQRALKGKRPARSR